MEIASAATLPSNAPCWCTTEEIMATKIITGTAAIDKAIKSIAGRGAKLDGDIQTAGLSVLAHVAEHGDTTLADRLFNAMPKGARRLALVEWMLAFGTMRVLDKKNDAERVGMGHVFGYDKERKLDMASAEATAWHEFRKEKAPAEVFDVQAAFNSLMSRIQAAQKKGIKIEHADLIEKLAKVA
jgi:hypothetical protein